MKKLLVPLLVAVTSAASADSTIFIIDGDTLKVDGETIRIVNIDAPESFKSRCDAESTVALKATERLQQLIGGNNVRVDPTGTDRYGRTLAKVYAGNVDVGATLIKEGFAVEWRPGRAAWHTRALHWCPGFSEEPWK